MKIPASRSTGITQHWLNPINIKTEPLICASAPISRWAQPVGRGSWEKKSPCCAYQRICVKMSRLSMVFRSHRRSLDNWIVISQRYTIGKHEELKLADRCWKQRTHILHDCPAKISRRGRNTPSHYHFHTYTHTHTKPFCSWAARRTCFDTSLHLVSTSRLKGGGALFSS